MAGKYFICTMFIVSLTEAVWPPAYKINLSQTADYVISESFSSDDDDVNEEYVENDEMIQDKDLAQFHLHKDNIKYYRLHKQAIRKSNKEENVVYATPYMPYKEPSFDNEESEAWAAGFVDESNNFISEQYEDTFASNKTNKKREEEILAVINKTGKSEDKAYDYSELQKDYNNEVKLAETSNNTLNYTEVKDEETVKESIEDIVNFKKPQNCTKEEAKGIGLGAARCLMTDLKTANKSQQAQMAEKMLRIAAIWFCIYLIIAIPFWCTRGWCCCCFQCRFCKPHRRIDEAKKFFIDNPLGVYHTEENEKIMYQPSVYEKYAQKKLEQAIMKL